MHHLLGRVKILKKKKTWTVSSGADSNLQYLRYVELEKEKSDTEEGKLSKKTDSLHKYDFREISTVGPTGG